MNLVDLVFDRWEWHTILAAENTTPTEENESEERRGDIEASYEVEEDYFLVRLTVTATVRTEAHYFLELTGRWQGKNASWLSDLTERERTELGTQALNSEALSVINKELEHLGNQLFAPYPQFEPDSLVDLEDKEEQS